MFGNPVAGFIRPFGAPADGTFRVTAPFGVIDGHQLKGTLISRILNQQATTFGTGTRFRPSPGTAEPPLASFDAGVVFFPDFAVEGGLAMGSRRWYGCWAQTPRGIEFGYLSETVLGPLMPIETDNP